MKRSIMMAVFMAGLVPAVSFANAGLAASRNCMGCHAIGTKVLGPSFKDVALKYAGTKDAEAALVQSVAKGSTGKWGAIAMPANNVSEQEAQTLVKWILLQK